MLISVTWSTTVSLRKDFFNPFWVSPSADSLPICFFYSRLHVLIAICQCRFLICSSHWDDFVVDDMYKSHVVKESIERTPLRRSEWPASPSPSNHSKPPAPFERSRVQWHWTHSFQLDHVKPWHTVWLAVVRKTLSSRVPVLDWAIVLSVEKYSKDKNAI